MVPSVNTRSKPTNCEYRPGSKLALKDVLAVTLNKSPSTQEEMTVKSMVQLIRLPSIKTDVTSQKVNGVPLYDIPDSPALGRKTEAMFHWKNE